MTTLLPPRTDREREAIRLVARRDLARRSFPDFLAHVKIRSDDPLNPGVVPFAPFTYQHDLAPRLASGESLVVLKARQIGFSTLMKAYCLWRAWNGWHIGYWSKGDDEALVWLAGDAAEWGLIQMAEALPAYLGVRVHRSDHRLTVGEGGIRVFPGTQAAGVSHTFQLVVADEASHHPYAAENYANYEATMSAGGQYICLSTANPQLGPTGWFYDMVQMSRANEVPYSFLFLPWSSRDGRDAAWLERRRSALKGNEPAFRANYPERPEDAFAGREGLVFWMFDEAQHWRGVLRDPALPALGYVEGSTVPVPWDECWERRYGTDYGGGDPSAVVVAGTWKRVGEEFSRIHVYGLGYWNENRAPTVEEVAEFLGRWPDLTQGENDPAPGGEVIRSSLRAMGFPGRRGCAKRVGITIVQQYMARGWLTFSADTCGPFLREMASYRWRKRTDGNSKERYDTNTPEDNHGDALDALRLLVYGVFRDEFGSEGAFDEVFSEVEL